MDNKYNVDDILNEIKRKKSARLSAESAETSAYPKPSYSSGEDYVPKRAAAAPEKAAAPKFTVAEPEPEPQPNPQPKPEPKPEPARVETPAAQPVRRDVGPSLTERAAHRAAPMPTYTDDYRDEPMANRRIQIDDTLQDFFRPKEPEVKGFKKSKKPAEPQPFRAGTFSVVDDDDSAPLHLKTEAKTEEPSPEEEVKVYSAAHPAEKEEVLATNYEELKRQRSFKVNSFAIENDDEINSSPDPDTTRIHDSVIIPKHDTPKETAVPPVAETPSTTRARTRFEEDAKREKANSGDITEYTSPDQLESLLKDFKRQKVSLILRLSATALIFAALVFMSLNAFGILSLPETFAFGDGTNVIFYITNILLLCIAVLVCHVPVGGGLLALFKLKANNDSLVAVSLIASLIHALLMVVLADRITVLPANIYFWLPALALVLNTVGKLFMLKRISDNFGYISKEGVKPALNLVDDIDLCKRLTGSHKGTNGKLSATSSAKHFSNFLDLSYDDDFSDSIFRIAAPIAVIVSLLVAAVISLINKDIFLGFTVFAALMAICAPFTSTLASTLPLSSTCSSLLKKGAMISSYSAAEDVADTDVVLVDATELFKADDIELHAIKTFSRGRVDEALLDAASVICQVKNTLNFIFDKVISGNTAMLKKFDNLVYEDGMGLSAWVDSKRVLIGNRMLMEHHGVETPDLEYEQSYTRLGQNVIYLSNSGDLTAMFILSYKPSPEIKEAFSLLCRRGVTLAVSSTDPNITAKLLSELFDFPADKISIVSSKYQDDFDDLCDDRRELPAKAATTGSLLSEAIVLDAAASVKSKVASAVFLQLVAMIIGCALVTFFAFIGGISSMSSVFVLIYQLLWAVIVTLFGTLRLK